MAHFRATAGSGQPFNIPENRVDGSVSGSWTRFADAVSGRPCRVQGIYWSATNPGSVLTIRDVIISPQQNIEVKGVVWYEAQCMGGSLSVDMFPSHLTLFTPFEYFEDEGDTTIIVYGEYI